MSGSIFGLRRECKTLHTANSAEVKWMSARALGGLGGLFVKMGMQS